MAFSELIFASGKISSENASDSAIIRWLSGQEVKEVKGVRKFGVFSHNII